MRLYEYDITMCNCGCGLPVSVAHKNDQFFIVDEDICYARRAIEKVRTQKREQAMRAKKGDGWDAGLKLHARAVTREQALEHMAKQQQAAEGDDVVGPRMAAAQAQRAERDQSQRLGARAREQQAQRRRVGGGR
jgi:hypothetical protein